MKILKIENIGETPCYERTFKVIVDTIIDKMEVWRLRCKYGKDWHFSNCSDYGVVLTQLSDLDEEDQINKIAACTSLEELVRVHTNVYYD